MGVGAQALVPPRTTPMEGIDDRGSGTAHTSPAGSQPASKDEGPLTQSQSQQPSPTSSVRPDGEEGGTPTSPHGTNTPDKETASRQPKGPHSEATDQGKGGGQGVAGSLLQDTAKRHKRQIAELHQNAKALRLAVEESLRETTRLRDEASESTRRQSVHDEQQRRLNEVSNLESATATSSMQLLMQSLQQLRDEAAAQNSQHKLQIEAMRQAAETFASASEQRHAQSIESVTTKASHLIMEAQQLAHTQRAEHDEHERNPKPGSSRRAPPLEQSGSHSNSDPTSGSTRKTADRQVFGSHRAEEEVVVGPDVRKLYRGPVTEEWIGADGVIAWVDPANPIHANLWVRRTTTTTRRFPYSDHCGERDQFHSRDHAHNRCRDGKHPSRGVCPSRGVDPPRTTHEVGHAHLPQYPCPWNAYTGVPDSKGFP
jgi:hypothetical protein